MSTVQGVLRRRLCGGTFLSGQYTPDDQAFMPQFYRPCYPTHHPDVSIIKHTPQYKQEGHPHKASSLAHQDARPKSPSAPSCSCTLSAVASKASAGTRKARMAGSDTLEVGTAAPAADATSNLLAAVLSCGQLNSDQEVFCKLLCCSKASAAAVSVSCSGQLAVDFDPAHNHRPSLSALNARCSSQGSWLKSNGHLVRELNCTYMVNPWQPKSALSELLPVLAGSTPKLQKLSGSIYLSTVSPTAQLAIGRVTSLTDIQLAIFGAEGGPGPMLAQLKQLPRLTHCELGLVGRGPGFMSINAAGLQHLPAQLTHLGLEVRLGLHDEELEELIDEAGFGELQCMLADSYPSGGGVREGLDTSFMFGARYPQKQAPMLLGHLTALKELKPVGGNLPGHRMACLDIRAGDVLPPNLTCLELHFDRRDLSGLLAGPLAVPTVEPMLALTSLQVLTIHDSSASAKQLQQLSQALAAPQGALREVSLAYVGIKTAAAAAAGWSSLPMVTLEIAVQSSNWSYSEEDEDAKSVSTVLTAIGGLKGLSKLTLAGHVSATQQELAAMLTGLSELKELTLTGSIKPQPKPVQQLAAVTRSKAKPGAMDAGKSAGSSATSARDPAALDLSSVVAALPSLQHLRIDSDAHDNYWYKSSTKETFPVSAGSLAAGSNVQQLTSLQLSGLTDADVQQLSEQLRRLKNWDLKSCKGVTITSLPVIARLADRGVLQEVVWVGSGVSEDAAKATGMLGALEAISVWRRGGEMAVW